MEGEYEDGYQEGAQPEVAAHCTCAETVKLKLEAEFGGLGCRMVGHEGFPSHRNLFKLASSKPNTCDRATYSMSSEMLRNLLEIPKRFGTKGVSASRPIPVHLEGQGGECERAFGGIGHMARALQVSLNVVTSRMDTGSELLVGVGVPGVRSGKYVVMESERAFIQRCEHVSTRGDAKGCMCGRAIHVPNRCSQHSAAPLKASLDRLRMGNHREFRALTRWMVEMSG